MTVEAARAWHILTCEYRPRVGGISDYVAAIATELAAAGHEVHVWAPQESSLPPEQPGAIVHQTFGRFTIADCFRTGRALNAHPAPRRLFVQWVPHGFGYKSLNLPFAVWLAWRALRGDDLHLMVHEPFMRWSGRPTHDAMSMIQRAMFAIAAFGAVHIWLSIDGWRPCVRPFVRKGVPVTWLPVPAPPVDRGDNHASVSRGRFGDPSLPLVGHFSTHSPVVTAWLAPALEEVLRGSHARALLIGRDSERFLAQFAASHPDLASRIHATGVVDHRSLPDYLGVCDLMLQPYPDGVNGRHTSLLLALLLGRCVVTNAGPLTEDLWRTGDAVVLADAPSRVGAAALDALADEPQRARVGTNGAALYDRTFHVRHAAGALTTAGADHHAGSRAHVSNVKA